MRTTHYQNSFLTKPYLPPIEKQLLLRCKCIADYKLMAAVGFSFAIVTVSVATFA